VEIHYMRHSVDQRLGTDSSGRRQAATYCIRLERGWVDEPPSRKRVSIQSVTRRKDAS
jgi:hypothetical protein